MYICNYKMSLQNPMVMSLQYWCNGEGWWREQHMSWACWATTTWWQKSAHHAVAALNCKRWTTRSDTVMPAKCLWMSLKIMLTEENCTTILRFSILHILPMHFKSKCHKTSRRAAFHLYIFSVKMLSTFGTTRCFRVREVNGRTGHHDYPLLSLPTALLPTAYHQKLQLSSWKVAIFFLIVRLRHCVVSFRGLSAAWELQRET